MAHASADAQLDQRPHLPSFERVIDESVSALAGSDWALVDDAVSRVLDAVLASTQADEVSFLAIERGDGLWTALRRSVRGDIQGPPALASARDMPWTWRRLVDQQSPLAFDGVHELPPEADADRRHLRAAGIHAALCVPIVAGGQTRHAIVVARARPLQGAVQRFENGLRLLGQVIASALERRRHGQAVDRSWGAEVERARRFSAAALDALDECFCVIDAGGLVVQTSAGWKRLGAEPAAPEGLPVGADLVRALETAQAPHAEHSSRLARGVKHVLAHEARDFELEFPRLTPSGHSRWLLARVRPFRFAGRLFAVIEYRDVTVHRGTAAELEGLRAHHWHSDRVTRTGVLIASLAHELCQPLAAILSNAQAGLRRIASDRRSGADGRPHETEIAEILADIVADDKRAVQVIESLRLMLRRQSTAHKPVDLCDIVRDVVSLLRNEFVRQGVQLELPQHAVGCNVLADRAQIQQVLLNVLLNGVEAMQSLPEAERRLTVSVVRADSGDVQVAVTDAGVGFTQEQLERSFQAFWTTKLRGTGLGLAICHSIVSSHGGRMWVEPRDGPGTTLIVALPLHVPPEPTTPEQDAAEETRS
ncbi:MAG TPA: ATP-binding protein [Caldimonas sp.]|nr:ATP-binding protein [Caldimonas sp.]